ncbi:YCF48-related protein [Bremerella alba]|uniref:Ycf48-like protein n=1 Tax=Bremerella alba TaxID=980252 RepID=A0A7V8V929_9BACT|nr:YCF48-related protein [Bremerella alba]MBA2117220.1 Ycf48-like protein [Bremerella alba]
MNGLIPALGRLLPNALLLTCLTVLASPAQAEVPGTWYLDAQLNDVTFVDDRHGLAVGDHGAIWHTDNGGLEWKQIPSGTDAHLASVYFTDSRHGWAVGGYQQPYSTQTRGVVLTTSDGGMSWNAMPEQSLPKLTGVRFEDTRHGWAVGHGSHMFPTGMFETNDGGRSWRSLPGTQNTRFEKFAVLPGGELLLAGVSGNLSLADRGGIRKPTILVDPLRDMQDIVVAGAKDATVVGEGGLILNSTNAGTSWEVVAPGPLQQTDRQVDFHAVERLGKQVWIAGDPGSFVLHSSNGGQSFTTQKLPTTATIRAIFFRSETTGWAVGSLGTILHTKDGGQTWSVQRQGGQRLALLGIFHDSSIIPYELVSHHAGSQGYLTGMEVINRPMPQTGKPRPPLRDALLHSGANFGHTAWQFPAHDVQLKLTGDQMAKTWDAANDGQGLAAAESYLVQRIRQWKPTVVLTDYADPTGKDPLAYMVNQLVLRAVEKAGDADSFPEQQAELGLAPWKVARVCSVVPEGQNGSITLNTTQISPQLAMSLSEHAGVSRGVATGKLSSSPSTLEMKVLRSSGLLEGRLSDIFTGLSVPAGKGARRPPQQMSLVDLAQLQRAAQKRRNMFEMINHSAKDEQRGALLLGQMLKLSEDLPPARSVEVLSHLAEKANENGNLTLSADMHHQIVRKFPTHVLAERSAAWLLAYYASSEMQFLNRDSVEFAAPTAPKEMNAEEETSDASEIATVSFNDPTNYKSPTKSPERAAKLIAELNQNMPHVLADPSLAFLLERLHAEQGHSRQGESYIRRLLNLGQENAWCRRAQWELVLGRGNSQVDAPIVAANYEDSKPVLDGRLNDRVWQTGKPVDFQAGTLSPEAGAPPAAMIVGFDEDYLYLAIRCMKSKNFHYEAPGERPRERDADLTSSDRVRIYLDLDRDYATSYCLSVDYRGRTADSLSGNLTWNPNWYVAADQDESTWTIEAAIPFRELSGQLLQPGDTWGMAVQRVMVSEGTEAWPSSALYEMGPAEFGLLQFR